MAVRAPTRVVLVALLVVGIAGATATGALSSVAADRDVTVSVATDDTALLALHDGHPNSGLIEQEGDGVLTVRFSRHGGDGVNRAFVTTMGDSGTPTSNHAFAIDNNGTQPRTVALEYTLAADASDGNTTERNIVFTFHVDRGGDGTIDSTLEISEHDGDQTGSIADVATTDRIYVTIRIDTETLGSASDLGGTLEITAGS